MATEIKLNATFPGELLAVELLKTIQLVIEGQPPEVKNKLWQWYIDDMAAWRKIWGLST